MKHVYIRTFGCQMNAYDTGKMRALLARDGFESTEDAEAADLVIINTCSVREKPEQKLHSFLGDMRAIKRRRPLTIAVAGCVAQQEGRALLKRYPDVDLVMGPDAIPQIGRLVAEASAGQVLDTEFLDRDDYVFASDLDPGSAGAVSAFVTIQKGCDNKCTFCVVPNTRGPELSRASGEILAEVRALCERGVREITLIGQNVNSYGLKVEGELSFAQLLYAVAAVPGVERIRYTTSHPRDMGADLVQAYRDLPHLTSHLHLPVQSGSDRVLRRMKRFYTRERFLEVVAALRDARPDLALTTDLIVGFPGETDEDFAETLSLVETVRFHNAFSFKYSMRPNTAALKLIERDAVPDGVSSARLNELQNLLRRLSLEENRKLEGSTLPVLVEGPSAHDEGVICGRTSSNKMINFPGELTLVGRTVPVTVTRAFTNSLRGELASSVGAVAASA